MDIRYSVYLNEAVVQRFRGLPFVRELKHIETRYGLVLDDLLKRAHERNSNVRTLDLDEAWRVGWVIKSYLDCVPWFTARLFSSGQLFVLPVDYMHGPEKAEELLSCTIKDVIELERNLLDLEL